MKDNKTNTLFWIESCLFSISAFAGSSSRGLLPQLPVSMQSQFASPLCNNILTWCVSVLFPASIAVRSNPPCLIAVGWTETGGTQKDMAESGVQ